MRIARVMGISSCLALGLAAGAATEPVQVRLENAGPEAIAKELGQALKTPVEVRGGMGKVLTLQLFVATPEAQVERVASALGGTWRMKLRVKPGRAEDGGASSGLDRRLLIGFQGVTAKRAFALIARELKADFEAEGDLAQRVTVLANGISAGEILDLIAEQAEATWSIAYEIEAPNARPPRPVAPEQPEQMPEPEPTPPPAAMPKPKPEPPLPVPSGPELRAGVHAAMMRLLRVPPDTRDLAVVEFLAEMEDLFRALGRLSPLERETRIRTMIPVLAPWKRLHQGLAPEVKKQLAPVLEVLEKHLRI